MALSELRKQKKEWLGNTVSSSYLKRAFKLSETDISKIKSEVRYGQERYSILDAKRYIDDKINKQSFLKFSGNSVTKMCKRCEKNVNESFFSNSKTEICIKCERKIELQTSKKLDKINESRSRKASRNQISLI